ncbi:hypothetical protein A1354_28965 [Pseudomonas asplenii]|nr:hypothetical protein A1354_28965 [Pseudomonas asplenii]
MISLRWREVSAYNIAIIKYFPQQFLRMGDIHSRVRKKLPILFQPFNEWFSIWIWLINAYQEPKPVLENYCLN